MPVSPRLPASPWCCSARHTAGHAGRGNACCRMRYPVWLTRCLRSMSAKPPGWRAASTSFICRRYTSFEMATSMPNCSARRGRTPSGRLFKACWQRRRRRSPEDSCRVPCNRTDKPIGPRAGLLQGRLQERRPRREFAPIHITPSKNGGVWLNQAPVQGTPRQWSAGPD